MANPVCIIHKVSLDIKPEEPLISPQTIQSWNTLLDAARIRNHTPILDLAKSMTGEQVPRVFYHRRCRSVFTMKKDLETCKRKAESCQDVNDSTAEACSASKRPARRSSSESCIYEQECIFCGKVKYCKGSKTREKLSKAVDMRADKTLREYAIRKSDTKILAQTSRDIVAAEAQYHFSCYREYTRPITENARHNISAPTSENDNIQEAAYEELFEFIQATIMPQKEIVTLTNLSKHLDLILKSKGTAGITDSQKKKTYRGNLKTNLEIVFRFATTIMEN